MKKFASVLNQLHDQPVVYVFNSQGEAMAVRHGRFNVAIGEDGEGYLTVSAAGYTTFPPAATLEVRPSDLSLYWTDTNHFGARLEFCLVFVPVQMHPEDVRQHLASARHALLKGTQEEV